MGDTFERIQTRAKAKVVHSPVVPRRVFKGAAKDKSIKSSSPSISKELRKFKEKKLEDTVIIGDVNKHNLDKSSLEMEGEMENLKRRLLDVEGFRNTITELMGKVTAGEEDMRELRNENERQRQKIVELENRNLVGDRNARENAPQGDNANILGNLINGLQRLSTDSGRPEFGDAEANPQEFIDRLERYFRVAGTNESMKLIIAEDALRGVAKLWLDARLTRFDTYAGFRGAFLEHYDSSTYRMRTKLNWSARRYNSRMGSMQEYYLRQIKEARFIFPDVTSKAINTELAQQFPESVRSSLAVADFSNNDTIFNALAYLDMGGEHRDRKRAGQESGDNFNKIRENVRKMGTTENQRYYDANGRGNDERRWQGGQGRNTESNRRHEYDWRSRDHAGWNSNARQATFQMPNTNQPPPNWNRADRQQDARNLN